MAKYLIILPDKGVKILFIQICLTCIDIVQHCQQVTGMAFLDLPVHMSPGEGTVKSGITAGCYMDPNIRWCHLIIYLKRQKLKCFSLRKCQSTVLHMVA
jgi:hypothetical protein